MPRSPFATHWDLDPSVTFLNHGSFGAAPRAVLEAQNAMRARMEAQPVRFMVRELEPLLDAARDALARVVGAASEDLAFVSNATTGVSTVLGSYRLRAGDEVLTTNHAYNACKNALDLAAERAGARVVVAEVPFPLRDAQEAIDAIEACFSARTRLLLIDHVTSPTGLVLPIADLVALARARHIDTLVDGAHTVGMLPLDLERLGATYYTGNLHKWLCAPKGAGFLWVRRDRRDEVRPLVISHGANSPRTDQSRFHLEFDWMGTVDPTPYLAIPACIEFFETAITGGLAAAMKRNRELAIVARDILCAALDVAAPAPDDMIGSLAAVPMNLPRVTAEPPLFIDPLQEQLYARGIEVPVFAFAGQRLLRVSTQLYNDASEYRDLATQVRLLAR